IYLNAKLIEFTVTDNDVFSPMKYILLLRNDIIELLVRNLKNNTGALSAALVTGDRYYLSNDVITAFRLAGVSHLTAISGLHLGVISGSFYYVAKRTGVPVKPRNVFIIALVIFYMALAGFSGSVTRAGIMFITVFSADLFKRKPDTLNSLGFAVFIICLNPFAVGDSGAVLSVLSVLSLITLYPYLKNQFSKVFDYLNDRRNRKTYPFRYIIAYVLKSVLLSVSVLLYTLPAVFLFFGYFNATSLVSNILLIPLGSIATVLSLLCYISLKLKFLCTAFVLTVSGVDSLIIILVKFFAGFELMRFSLTGWFSFVIAAVLAVFAVNFIVFKNKTLKTAFVITFIILAFSLAINAFTQYNITI
ncbi:MAG: ComEC/Rec2 family competence protein, partial [Eubacterium sp.]|nr:ComEC/Rec2 family competence protein [Eubacterium sp.]